MDFNSEFTALF